MTKKMSEQDLWRLVKDKLEEQGIRMEELLEMISSADDAEVRVLCAVDDLGTALDELASCSRDQVLMVRADTDTMRELDAWTETGAVKSRSEAAALFIREGLKLRRRELGRLDEALKSVQDAKARLKEEARKVLGDLDTLVGS